MAWPWPDCLQYNTCPNRRVVFTGLTGATELNGKPGEVKGYDPDRERYQVQVEGMDRPVNAKVDNVRWDTAQVRLLLDFLAVFRVILVYF